MKLYRSVRRLYEIIPPFTFQAEPTTISLTLDGQEVTDGEEFEMKAGDVKDITCSVGGSNPAPDVKVIVEDKNGKTVKDLSKNFQMVKTVSDK